MKNKRKETGEMPPLGDKGRWKEKIPASVRSVQTKFKGGPRVRCLTEEVRSWERGEPNCRGRGK
jgi:hypothetical protein